MDGGKAMVSRNIVLSKILPMKGRQYLYRCVDVRPGPLVLLINIKAKNNKKKIVLSCMPTTDADKERANYV